MKTIRHNAKGFTLLEIIVVLAVIGALAAILSPMIFRYIDDANRGRAQSDANTIAGAVNQMYKDTGRWAFYKTGTGAISRNSTDDAAILTSSAGCNAAAPAAMACDTTAPVTGTGWGDFSTVKAHSLASQLIENDPAYSASGSRAWKGPYLDAVPALDPWGRSYLVNIGNANPNEEGPTTQKWVVVISAGPDGNIDTTGNTVVNANPAVAGDDVVARVK